MLSTEVCNSFGATAAAGIRRSLDEKKKTMLFIHCVGGCHEREGRGGTKMWQPAIEAARTAGFTYVHVAVVGPTMEALHTRSDAFELEHVRDLYHDWKGLERPDLRIFFHPGFWGYIDWAPTLRMVLGTGEPPLLVTSYTMQEAELDARTIANVLANKPCFDDNDDDLLDDSWLWRPEVNAHASMQQRPTATAPAGHVYRENSAWQCILPPRTRR